MSTGATSSRFSISRKLITIPVQITSTGIHYITPRNLREPEAPSLCTCLYHRLFGKAQLHHTCSSYTYTGGDNKGDFHTVLSKNKEWVVQIRQISSVMIILTSSPLGMVSPAGFPYA
ncbi:hypothetical protein FRX31_027130 [Thalictrum thalictroides]|uniref:Uncharacterized protein n=1 Tax=Thalictrum thalictroides TaxID=46969 RepID=A0A7J6VEG3_THATH|nr:hypothetical protein FRX31_027130 [Thalictrum thalictroides]